MCCEKDGDGCELSRIRIVRMMKEMGTDGVSSEKDGDKRCK